ncbi:Helo-N domain containing protein [Pyrenophora tritici-repentis]|nr:Helo-N domain containing protein [Pyrenophora tritici-repentis]
MAEPISLASGVLTLVIFAHKSCLTLYKTIQSFKTHPKRVRNLIDELEALISVLESLSDTMKLYKDVDIPTLDLPLRRCSSACDEFLQELHKCCARSGGDRQSFRDWAKLRYMGDDIDDFTDSLAAYKSTITIALTDMQLRKSSIALERLGDYKDLITTATNDLEARLGTIDEKLQSLVERTTSSSATTELQRLKDERSSTQKCLLICAQFSKLIQQLQSSSAKDLPKA